MLFWLSTKSSLHLYQYEHAYQHLSSVLAGNILVSYCTMHCGCGESFNSSNRASKDLHLVGASMPVIGVHAWGKGVLLLLEVEGLDFLYGKVQNMVALLLQIVPNTYKLT
ncbi:uncharacterized protein LOC114379454 isoform X2 [Glycine soja]|uniref:uncharacterized protein LOC114379454 isoform X2 n=1 Tax=Glycine soja TaxID=3848 RepID=UPI0010399DB8|nr:uncharacterized protein LOC114379454 isoform X2 [Glycine soja]